ncbi:hypothetical protein HID58_020747 [Brassica napus]|uniref:Uncharacterized protein n=1 Tax=Brassica napus TaxID=3708 RepID=A0ABQ8CUG7_BRANA|nr:hypothetical protein HID58_020747 [Brassica napus]
MLIVRETLSSSSSSIPFHDLIYDQSIQTPLRESTIGKSGVSPGLKIGDPNSKKAKGKAAVSSSSPTKLIGKTGVSSGLSIDNPHSKKLNDLSSTTTAADEVAEEIRRLNDVPMLAIPPELQT